MTAAAAPSPSATTERPSVLETYRGDGPLGVALGRALGHGLPLPAIALLVVAALPGLVAIVVEGDGASNELVAAAIAWAVLLGGISCGRPLTDPFRWMVPPALRVIEYAGLLWIATVAGPSSEPAAFALLAAITYLHYDTVYGLRHRGATPPAWLRAATGGWEGRLLAGVVVLLAGALPAAFFVGAAALAVLLVIETVTGWRRFHGLQHAYDDEEDEAD